jgi:hypothetical protein
MFSLQLGSDRTPSDQIRTIASLNPLHLPYNDGVARGLPLRQNSNADSHGYGQAF